MKDYNSLKFSIFFTYKGCCLINQQTFGGSMMRNKTLISIGKRLADIRKSNGYTQEQLANITGLSVKMISAAENGHKAMRPENIIKICDCLNTSADYLLFGQSACLNSIVERTKIDKLSAKQREALSKIVEDFLSAFDD